MLNHENMDPKAEQHLVVQGHRVIGKFPSLMEANNRAASLAPTSPYEIWVVHLIGEYEGGSVCFTTNYGDRHDHKSAFHPDGNLELPNN